jgi:N-acetylmuramoyl-L-alanine amidase
MLCFRKYLPVYAVTALCLSAIPFAHGGQNVENARVAAIRFWSFGDVTRIAVETVGEYKLASDQISHPDRVYFDLKGLMPPSSATRGVQTISVGDPRVKEIRVAEVTPGKTRIVFDLAGGPADVVSSQLVNPERLMIEIRHKGAGAPPLSTIRSSTGSQRIDLDTAPGNLDKDPALDKEMRVDKPVTATLPTPPAVNPEVPTGTAPMASASGSVATNIAPLPTRIAPPVATTTPNPDAEESLPSAAAPHPNINITGVTAATNSGAGDPSLVRVFGLKLGRVVIDPGHGGKDAGTIGPNGLAEKDLVLDVSLRLGKLIRQKLGADVVYTRHNDTFIPLEERTVIANREKADLFISVHANASKEPSVTGVETYYFNLNSDKKGLELAMRENASSGSSISDLNDLLHRAVLQTKLEESREFAEKVQESLCANSIKMNAHARNRGVRQAPFVVLIGATMPSILAEVGFVSNPRDERLLKRGDQRQKIADALLKGVMQYASSLSHLQIARAGSD